MVTRIGIPPLPRRSSTVLHRADKLLHTMRYWRRFSFLCSILQCASSTFCHAIGIMCPSSLQQLKLWPCFPAHHRSRRQLHFLGRSCRSEVV